MTDESKLPALPEVAAFLDGSAPLDGVWYGERHPTEPGAFWWRKYLRAAVAAVAEDAARYRWLREQSGDNIYVCGVHGEQFAGMGWLIGDLLDQQIDTAMKEDDRAE